MTEPKTEHGTFCIERVYAAAPAVVFEAFANPNVKRKWFAGGEDWAVDELSIDFRVGGREVGRFRRGDGPEIRNDTYYFDILADQRIVYSYTMAVSGRLISVSVATVGVFADEAGGTRLTYTEQGTYLDGRDEPGSREKGCQDLFDNLGRLLEAG